MSLKVEIRKGGEGKERGEKGGKMGRRGERWGEKGERLGRRIYWSHGSNMTDKLMEANSLNSQVKVIKTGLNRKS